MKIRKLMMLSVASIGFSTSAFAQQENPAIVDAGLQEIVVTAQKREQNMQDVPVAITAITGDALTQKGVGRFEDLAQVSPSLTITKGTNVTGNSINLRGIGTSAFSVAVESAVAVIVDDLVALQQGQAFAGLGDVERVEVLRGPQGTLFGKGASAGAINIITKGPSADFSGSLSASATLDEQFQLEGGVSGPLGENVGFRINGYYNNKNGYIRNLFDNRKFGKEDSWGIHGRLDFQVSDNLKFKINGNYGDEKTNGTVRTLLAMPDGTNIFRVSKATLTNGLTPGYGNDKVYVDGPQFTHSKTATASLTGTLDLGPASLISITGYQDWKFDFLEDVDVTASNILGSPTGVIQGAPIHSKLFSQEFRLVSNTSGPLQYLAGLYYGDGKTTRINSRTPVSVLLSGWASANQSTTYAAFAQATYDITPTTHVDGGIRFNREEIAVQFTNTLTTGACRVTCVGNSSDDQVTGKIALRQDLNDRVMVYASFATGYKGQGYDIATGFTQSSADSPVKAETSKAYELGFKSRFLDNRVQLNVAAFLTDYKNFQAQSGLLNPDGSVTLKLNNVGKLRTKGIEVELLAMPTDALTINFNGAYTDATIVEFPFANCFTGQTAAQGCFDRDGAGPGTATAQNLAGKPLSNSPKFKYTIGANYDIELGAPPFDAFIGFDFRYQSRVGYDLGQNPALAQQGFGIMNTNVGLKSDDGKLRLTFFVQNLFDKAYAVTLAGATGASAGTIVQQVLPRDYSRIFGVRFNGKF